MIRVLAFAALLIALAGCEAMLSHDKKVFDKSSLMQIDSCTVLETDSVLMVHVWAGDDQIWIPVRRNR